MRGLFEGGVYSRALFINLVGKCAYAVSTYIMYCDNYSVKKYYYA